MLVSQRLVCLLGFSCLLAFGAAIWAFASGFGLLISFMIYAFGGATLLLGFSAIAVYEVPNRAVAGAAKTVAN